MTDCTPDAIKQEYRDAVSQVQSHSQKLWVLRETVQRLEDQLSERDRYIDGLKRHLERLHHTIEDRALALAEDYKANQSAFREAFAKVGERQDVCRKGHALTPDNVLNSNGVRRCRACRRESNKRAEARAKERVAV